MFWAGIVPGRGSSRNPGRIPPRDGSRPDPSHQPAPSHSQGSSAAVPRERRGRVMARLSDANVSLAKEIIGRYPRPKSALIPLLHLAQEQDGHLTNEAMTHIAELIGHTPAE